MEPIVQFSKMIKKNTADFTAYDISKYIDWLWSRDEKEEKTMQDNKNNEELITLTLTPHEFKVLMQVIHKIIISTNVNMKKEDVKVLTNIYKIFKDFVKEGYDGK